MNDRVKSSCEILDVATLAARFTFDGASPLTDIGPNSVIATASNYSIIAGHVGNALSFTGLSNSYFQASGFTSLGIGSQSFSISFWIISYSLSGIIVHLSTSTLGNSSCFPLLGFESNGSLVAQINMGGTTFATAIGPILSTSSPSWSLVVQTWSSTNGLRLYINDTLFSSVSTGSTFGASGKTPNYLTLANCRSGCDICSSGSVGAPGPFSGSIDDWRMYSRELTAGDVCTLYFST